MAVFLGIFLTLILLPACYHNSAGDLKANTFKKLIKIREKKKEDVIRHFHKIEQAAQKAGNDQDLISFFHYYQSGHKVPRFYAQFPKREAAGQRLCT